MMESRIRVVLDTPLARGTTACCGAALCISRPTKSQPGCCWRAREAWDCSARMRSARVPPPSGDARIGGDAVGGSRCLGRNHRFGGQHGLDRRIRSFDLHREFGDFGGDIVDAFAQQRIFHALGRPRTLGLLLDRVEVALQPWRVRRAPRRVVPRPPPFRPSACPAPAICRCWWRRFRRALPWRRVRRPRATGAVESFS